jgi:nucleotide-binding universal stress UspA family protein
MTPADQEEAPQRRVLVCTDESELGELARQWAGQCARELGVALVTLQGSSAATLTPADPADLLVLGLADSQGRVPHAAVDLVAAAPCLTILMRANGGHPQGPVTAAVSGDPSDEAILAAAVDLAAICHAEVRLLHTHPLPLRRSDSPEERWAGRTVLESALRQILRLIPDYTPSTELVRLQAQEAVGHHSGDGLLVVGARRTPHPGLGTVTRTALHHARSPVAVAHTAHPTSERTRPQEADEPNLSRSC